MSYGGLAMSPAWRTILLAGLAALLLMSAGKRLAIGAGTPQQIGSGLVLVPAGWFIMGGNQYTNHKPQRRVYLDAFYIDKYPVTNAQFRRFGKPRKDYGSKFNGERQPVVGVTWGQARDYCRSLGKRLLVPIDAIILLVDVDMNPAGCAIFQSIVFWIPNFAWAFERKKDDMKLNI